MSPPTAPFSQMGPDSPAISTRSRDVTGALDPAEVVSLRSTLANREAQIQELELLLSKSNAALQERDATIDALTTAKINAASNAALQERSPQSPPPRRKTLDPPQRQQSASKVPGRHMRQATADSNSEFTSTPARSPSAGAGDRSASPGTRKSSGSAVKRHQRAVSQDRAPKQALVIEKFVSEGVDSAQLALEVGAMVDVLSVSGPWAVVKLASGQSGEVPAMCLNMEEKAPPKAHKAAKKPQRMVSADRALQQVSSEASRSPTIAAIASVDPATDRRSIKSEADGGEDEIDPMVRKYLEERNVQGLELHRVRKNWYICTPTGKRVFMKLAGKDKVIVRVGGGYVSLHKFVEEYLIPVIQSEEAEAKRLEQPL